MVHRCALRRGTPGLCSAVVTECCSLYYGTAMLATALRRGDSHCLSWMAGDKIVCIPHAATLACRPECVCVWSSSWGLGE